MDAELRVDQPEHLSDIDSISQVSQLLSAVAARTPNSLAVIDTASATDFTWAQLDKLVNQQARRFLAAGVNAGDRVAMALGTSVDFVVTFFAITRIGAIAVPMSAQTPVSERTKLLAHSGCRLVITDSDESWSDVQQLKPLAEAAISVGGEAVAPVGGHEDIAVLSYTSGTTGQPRGVMLSHRALLANVTQLGAVRPAALTPRDRILLPIPLFHVYGLGPGLLYATAVGATMVLAPRFDAHQALFLCAQYRVTVLAGVPAMYAAFAELSNEELGKGLATVRQLSSGAAPLHPKLLIAIQQATGLGIHEGYGLTEASPVLTSTLVSGKPKPGSVGQPLPGIQLRLVDSDGSTLPEEDVDDPTVSWDNFADEANTGLVAVKGANLFSGYWPDGSHGPDSDGWFRTGDVGYLDSDGDLHLVDRANDLVIVNGFNVYPHEVEDVIDELPQVREVAVVGVLDEHTGEAVKAVIVLEPGFTPADLPEQRLIEHCADRLAGYKVPRVIEFAETLPRSATGKLRRLHLR